MTKMIIKKIRVLTEFAKRIPNADKMLVDYWRDDLSVYFGQHSKSYSINEILETFKNRMKKEGLEIIYD